MLELLIGYDEGINDDTGEFVRIGGQKVLFEHSLVSLSKWESKFEKAFLGPDKKTSAEVFAYIECCIVSPDFPPEGLVNLTQWNIDEFNKYINTKQTATTFRRPPTNPAAEQTRKTLITSELIYYWMITYTVPMSCETWFLNRLLTLIEVCQAKAEEANARQNKGKRRGTAPMAPSAIQDRNALNAQRRAQYATKG